MCKIGKSHPDLISPLPSCLDHDHMSKTQEAISFKNCL